ncbi:aspartate carbamoyltransferase [Pandoraea sp.]|uniref:aspartate carbamoyltransferase n=1 Tax=Pandoraea sp. TaxID=1883445 RepID=UPI0025D50F59|nr:aspartate carbamoyltransferase [Pandoraea sp.]
MIRPCTAWLCAAIVTGALGSHAIAGESSRQKEVAQRGAEVMPFALSATTHIFTKTAHGGIQQVVTKRPDQRQTTLIRQHLALIAKQFAQGNFSAPAQIHGMAMPGLATLRAAKPGALQVHYRDVPNGGEIVYRSAQPRLVHAVHQWFDAQLTDHGHDAMAGSTMDMSGMHDMGGMAALHSHAPAAPAKPD